MKRKREVTLLLPVYNEAGTIEDTVLQFHEKIGRKIPLEIVIAEDGSTDGTKGVIRRLSKKIPIRFYLDSKRKGYSKALKDGLKKVRTRYVVCVDSDGQHYTEDFWKLYRHRNEYDIVSGYRIRRADDFHRRIMSNTFQALSRIMFSMPGYKDMTGPYKLIGTQAAKEISKEMKHMKESFWSEFTIRAHRKGFTIKEVPVRHRKARRSTNVYTVFKIPKIVLFQLIGLFKLRFER